MLRIDDDPMYEEDFRSLYELSTSAEFQEHILKINEFLKDELGRTFEDIFEWLNTSYYDKPLYMQDALCTEIKFLDKYFILSRPELLKRYNTVGTVEEYNKVGQCGIIWIEEFSATDKFIVFSVTSFENAYKYNSKEVMEIIRTIIKEH